MNKLPSEIQDIIYNHYWQFKFQDVLNELTKCFNLEKKIKKFLYTYCFKEILFQKKYIHYLKLFNENIKEITKKKFLKNICNFNRLTLFYCFDETYKDNICSSIDENLKYIAMFSLGCSGQMRYIILNRFQQLSNYKILI
tara:strand:+ start:52 stop:471 length:420 start_codon:yes stop_codon:yes gene_type:complete